MIAALAPGVLEGLEGQGLALADLTVLLVVGGSIGAVLGMKRWGLPEALLAGGLGLLVAPTGLLPLLPQRVIDLWDQLPLPLLTLVFATLLLGKPLPKLGGLWRPLSAQVLLALTLAFGQFLVGGLAVLLVLQPRLGVSPVMACLIEVAYEGGHGSAAAMGPTYERLGLEGAQALGLGMATVGLLASTVVGGLLVVLGRARGWLMFAEALPIEEALAIVEEETPPLQEVPMDLPLEAPTVEVPALWRRLADWAVNLALAGVAVLIGCGALAALRWAADGSGGIVRHGDRFAAGVPPGAGGLAAGAADPGEERPDPVGVDHDPEPDRHHLGRSADHRRHRLPGSEPAGPRLDPSDGAGPGRTVVEPGRDPAAGAADPAA